LEWVNDRISFIDNKMKIMLVFHFFETLLGIFLPDANMQRFTSAAEKIIRMDKDLLLWKR
jgi:hypothetical protein